MATGSSSNGGGGVRSRPTQAQVRQIARAARSGGAPRQVDAPF